MAKDGFDRALTGFRRWTETTGRKLSDDPGVVADEMETLFDLMRGYLDIDRPAELSEGDFRELLLRIYPRKVTVFDPEDTESTIPAIRDFLAYLAERGEMPEGKARALGRELDRIEPLFADAVMDPSNWGMARSLVQAMAADGVDMDDQAAVDQWIAAYNDRPERAVGLPGPWDDIPGPWDDEDDEDEDISLKDAFGLPDRLPPMRLPSEAELAAMARSAPMMDQLRLLAAWLGSGRAVTENAELAGGDIAEAAAAIGGSAAAGQVRDLPRLDYLWRLALEAGFVELDEDETHALPGETAEALGDGDDDEVLDIWEMVFALVLSTLDVAASLDPRRSSELDFSGHGAALAVTLFMARPDGLPVAEVSKVIQGASTDELPPERAAKAWQSWVRAHGDPAQLLLGQMTEAGAVRISDGADGDLARLTPLGLAAIRTQLAESGVEIPLLPPAGQMTAADLLAMADGVSEEEFQAETAAWLAGRTTESAARDLLSAAAETDPAARMLAVTVVTELGAPAGPAWRDALGRLELRGYAKVALAAPAGSDPATGVPADLEPSPDDLAWMLIDGLVLEGWDDLDDDDELDPAALGQSLREAIPAGQEPAVFEVMARVPHPDAAAVLTMIGRHHPDKKVAKAARKSAYKAASRRATQRQ